MEALRQDDPTSLGGYQLLGRLGAGSMGVVYLGQDGRGHPVAVKTVATAISADEEYRSRFRREVELALRVSSPYTARVIGADTEATRPYMVTEYVAGETLKARVSRAGPLEQEQVLALAAGLSSGLTAIHAAGVTHRDLSAGNIILATDGPKIVDLGVAYLDGATQLTQAGTSWGTPAFMSPEHATGRRVGPPSDVFSWGSLIVFAATGRAPFGSGRPEQLMYRIVHESPETDEIPDALRPSVSEALRKDPNERPTAAELVQSTARLLGDDADATIPVAELISRTWRADAMVTEPVWGEATTPVKTSKSSRWAVRLTAGIALVAAAAIWINSSSAGQPDTTPEAAVTTAAVDTTPSTAPSPPAELNISSPSGEESPSTQTPSTAPSPSPAVEQPSPPSASPTLDEPSSATETAPGRPDPPNAPWNTAPVAPTGHLQSVADTFYSDLAEWDGCTLYAPTEVETGLLASASFWSPIWTRFGFFNFEWSYPDDDSPASTVYVYPPDDQGVTQFFEDDPDGTTFADGSVLRLGGEEGLTHLLTVPGEDCYYAFRWYSMVGLSYVETVRPISPPSASDEQALGSSQEPTGTPLEEQLDDVPGWALDEVEAETGDDWWVIQEHWTPGSTLNAFVAAPEGSATGRGRHVFFFVEGRGYISRDLPEPSEASQIAWSTNDTIAVEYTLYRDDDPGCCPTGGSSTVRFEWTGDELAAQDPIPPLNGPIHR